MNNYEALDNLHLAIATHDWWYQYSDDHGVWSRGQKEKEEISRRVSALGEAGTMLHKEWTKYVIAPQTEAPIMPSDRPHDDPLLEQWRKQTEE